MNFRTYLLFFFFMFTLQQDYYCNVNTADYPNHVKVGNSFVVCIHFKDSDGNNQRGVFPIVVDQYTALQLQGAFEKMSPINKTVNYSIVFQTQNSPIYKQALFYNSGTGKMASMMSFIIFSNKGNVQIIQDDNNDFCNGCSNCASYTNNVNQTHKNCFVEPNSTSSSQVLNSGQDPKIFVSWMGTDSQSQYLLSQTRRISRFTQYSMNNVFESALNMFQKI